MREGWFGLVIGAAWFTALVTFVAALHAIMVRIERYFRYRRWDREDGP